MIANMFVFVLVVFLSFIPSVVSADTDGRSEVVCSADGTEIIVRDEETQIRCNILRHNIYMPDCAPTDPHCLTNGDDDNNDDDNNDDDNNDDDNNDDDNNDDDNNDDDNNDDDNNDDDNNDDDNNDDCDHTSEE